MAELVMPRLSDSMEEGTVLRWLRADGDTVRCGEDLVEIETDKATMTHQSDQDGVLHIIAGEGDTLPVGAAIARVGDAASSANGAGGEPAAAPDPAETAGAKETRAGQLAGAAPVARRTGGTAVAAPQTTEGSPTRPSPADDASTGRGQATLVELTRTQQVVARRMAESRATVPDFTIEAEIDMQRCLTLRAELKDMYAGSTPTFNDMIVRACALALREFPRANATYRDARFELHSRVNIGVAVAARDTLIVPTVFDADRKSLATIASETRALAERVRAGAITPPEVSGATFTVSNLGMYGITSFTAVINPPQAAILAVGSVAERPVVRDGALVARHTVHVTLACDHRILYGADAAEFLARVRELLERPLALAIGSGA